jgi:hypothetical protein
MDLFGIGFTFSLVRGLLDAKTYPALDALEATLDTALDWALSIPPLSG